MPSTNASATSSTIRSEYALIAAGFDKLPTLTGNGLKAICVNTGATALEAVAVTGTGSVVRATTPTLVTPVLGVATATSINSLTITTSTGTLTITNGKTVSISNTLTLTATDGSTLAIGAGGTLGTGAYATINQYALLISPSFTTPSLGVATATSLAATTLQCTSATGSIGYTKGNTVTQITSKSTAVTINAICGSIVTHNAALNAGVEVTFTVNNTQMSAADVVIVNLRGGGTANSYVVVVAGVSGGNAFDIMISNMTASNLSEALTISFAIIKASDSPV